MDESQNHCAQLKKSRKKVYMLYDSSYKNYNLPILTKIRSVSLIIQVEGEMYYKGSQGNFQGWWNYLLFLLCWWFLKCIHMLKIIKLYFKYMYFNYTSINFGIKKLLLSDLSIFSYTYPSVTKIFLCHPEVQCLFEFSFVFDNLFLKNI